MAKSMKRTRFQLSALAAALCLSATGANAAGLGKITVLSPLGQPLRAEIDVNATAEELPSMNARLASPEAFRQAGVEYVPGIAGIRFAVEKRKDGQSYLRMISDRPINEPFLDVLVELIWSSGRVVREYTVLLDPPEGMGAAAPVAVVAPTVVKPAPAPKLVAAPAPVIAPAPVAAAAPAPVTESPAPVAEKPASVAPSERVATKPADDSATRRVQTGDTLTRIAVATKPEGVSLDQMLVALFQSNQGAFDGSNMNRLRAGKILNIPSAEVAAAVPHSEARDVIVTHSKDFNAYRSKLAASVAATPAKEEGAKQADQGKIAPRLAEKPAAAELLKDKLEVSRTEATKDAKALRERVTALEEDIVARERALKEANSRVSELEKNVADLKKLAELRSQAGVQAQTQAEAAKPAVGVKPEPVQPIVEPPKVSEEVKPVESPKPAEAPVPTAEAPKPAMEAPAAEAKAPPVPAPEPAVSEEPSFIDENPMLVYGGGGLIVLLLAYLGLSRRRKASGDEAVSTVSRLSEGDLMANSVFGTTGGQAVDTSASIQTDFSQASLSSIDTDEGVDPVAEADVYMAYGRDAQAEEILLDALKSDPARHAIYLKLLEIYSGHKNLAKFEKVAGDLKTQTGGSGPDWEKAAAMGRVLDAGNPLYASTDGDAIEQALEPIVPEVSTLDVEPGIDVVQQVEKKLENTVTLPGQLAQMAKAATPASAEFPPSLGFDLDLGSESPALSSEKSPSTPSGFESVTTELSASSVAPDVGALDVDLSLPELGASLQSSASHIESAGVDFEFDLDAPAPTATKNESPLDFSGINLDLVTSPTSSATEAAEPALAEGDNPDVATKLELALAYEEMGDREGARELLEEVVQEGSVRQQEVARNKLAALDA